MGTRAAEEKAASSRLASRRGDSDSSGDDVEALPSMDVLYQETLRVLLANHAGRKEASGSAAHA